MYGWHWLPSPLESHSGSNAMSLTKQQALDLFRSDDLIGIGMEADAVRRKLHPEGVVTYIIDRNINYTNFCTEYCTFCAFYRPLRGPRPKKATSSSRDDLRQDSGDPRTGRHRRADAGRPASRSEDRVVREDAARHQAALSEVHLHCFSAPEIIDIAEYSGSEHSRHHRRGCAMPASIPFPAAAPRFWTTKSATGSPA